MKKSFLLIPMAVVLLSACSSSTTPAPVESVDGTLSPGMMQPVDGAISGSSWEPQVQQGTMPFDMNTPVLPQQTTPQIKQPMSVSQSVQPQQAVTQQVQKVSQNFEIPRNPTTNAPDYSKIDKGFYKGSSYTVRKGDTMFLIAYISGMDVKELAALNNMAEPYTLKVGQTLKVNNGNELSMATVTQPVTQSVPQQVTQPVIQEPAVTYTAAPNGTQYGSDGTITGPVKASAGTANTKIVTTPVTTGTVTTQVTAPTVTTPTVTTPVQTTTVTTPVASNISWIWPTNGKVVQGFSNSDGGNKGIDISGSKGQAVQAAAGGRVVYAGNALRGYGNLIIIKHNDDFLSAYAHNDSISVKDQQEVRAGQQIAKMGSTGTNSVKLHFEIRYKGKSVDPMRYLPRR